MGKKKIKRREFLFLARDFNKKEGKKTGFVELALHVTFFISCEMSTSAARNKTDRFQ